MSVITPQRLVQLSTNYANLTNTWYIVASAALSSANRSKEIPKVYHMALQQSLGHPVNITTATRAIEICDGIQDAVLSSKMGKVPHIDHVGYREQQLTLQIQDALLKSLIITGVPRAINSLTAIRDTLPSNLHTSAPSGRKYNGDTSEVGNEYFKLVYDKVTDKVIHNLYTSYPDLHDFIINSCYGEVIAYTDILSAKDTSLAIIGALVPQDTPPQLKGHLRGALNVGNTVAESNDARQMAVDICHWCDVKLEQVPAVLKRTSKL